MSSFLVLQSQAQPCFACLLFFSVTSNKNISSLPMHGLMQHGHGPGGAKKNNDNLLLLQPPFLLPLCCFHHVSPQHHMAICLLPNRGTRLKSHRRRKYRRSRLYSGHVPCGGAHVAPMLLVHPTTSQAACAPRLVARPPASSFYWLFPAAKNGMAQPHQQAEEEAEVHYFRK